MTADEQETTTQLLNKQRNIQLTGKDNQHKGELSLWWRVESHEVRGHTSATEYTRRVQNTHDDNITTTMTMTTGSEQVTGRTVVPADHSHKPQALSITKTHTQS